MEGKMDRIEGAVREIDLLGEQAENDNRLNQIPALLKMILTVWYLFLTVSFDRYDIYGLLSMGIYPLLLFLVYEIPFYRCFRRILPVLPMLLLMGAANPFFDTGVAARIGSIRISGGMLSMATLVIKGFFTVLAGYLLIVSTGIVKICASLRRLHIPSVIVTMILLSYRYISLLLQEAGKMTQAYRLRAPRQKGIHVRTWGSFTGLLLLRSMDRAENVYESMCLRGFDGTGRDNAFSYAVKRKPGVKDYVWFFSWTALLLFFRLFPVFTVVGNLIL